MEILSKLFGSETKVKIIRLFLFNPETVFDTSTIATRVGEDIAKVRRELIGLEKILFVRRRAKKMRGKTSGHGFALNMNFSYLGPLQIFLTSAKPLQPTEIIRKFTPLGTVKFLAIAGLFTRQADSRVDLLIVGDNIKKSKLEKVIKGLEAEIGKEIRYAYFTTPDFLYRLDMYDKLVRDILDYPHERLVNKLAIL
jgi:hypothetical protein